MLESRVTGVRAFKTLEFFETRDQHTNLQLEGVLSVSVNKLNMIVFLYKSDGTTDAVHNNQYCHYPEDGPAVYELLFAAVHSGDGAIERVINM